MKNEMYCEDSVSIYHKNICIHANGQSANIIAFKVLVMLILIGITVIGKAFLN